MWAAGGLKSGAGFEKTPLEPSMKFASKYKIQLIFNLSKFSMDRPWPKLEHWAHGSAYELINSKL